MPELAVGEIVEMKGSGSKPYRIKNCGAGGYSCTCPAWRNQSQDPALRTCKHITKLRGEAAEQERLGAAGQLPTRKSDQTAEKQAAPPVLLAEAWDNETNLAGWWMSEKLDGVRAYWDGKRFISRQGNLFLAPPWFVETLPTVPLDGELWMGRKAFQRAVGIAKRQDMPQEWKEMRYVVFDAPSHGSAFETRLEYLQEVVSQTQSQYLQLLNQELCKSVDHLRQELKRVEELGGEGLMLRQPGSKYESGRSTTLLKVKTFHDAEARVIGYVPGEGKHEGRVGSLAVKMANGVQFYVGTGLTNALREHPPAIGTLITFRYQEFIEESGAPRFPSFVGVRRDGEETPAPTTPVAETKPAGIKVSVPAEVPVEVVASTPRRFHFGEGDAARVWEVSRAGAKVTVKFGPVASLKTKQHSYASEAAAMQGMVEMIADKIDDGFIEAGQTPPRVKTPAKPAPAEKAPAPAVAVPAGTRRFEFVEGTSSKFWEVSVSGNQVTTRWGRIGTAGQNQTKEYADEGAAKKAAEKQVNEKLGKGYQEKK